MSKKNKDLSKEDIRKLTEEVYREMQIADSTSGHEPLPLLPEKTSEENKNLIKKFTDLYE